MTPSLELALVYGSSREGRLCDTVAAWAAETIAEMSDFAVDPVDPLALGLPSWHEAQDGRAVAALQRRLHQADAFVVVTPEYNHGYPASLKFLIDSVSQAWQAKPVGFVSYGGLSGGLRAVEQLRQVFAELHAVTLRDGVALVNAWEQFDAQGRLHEPPRPRRAMARMLAQLRWWATALRAAREHTPYGRIGV
jgi:NAD(P)H-dependent FMN reductase